MAENSNALAIGTVKAIVGEVRATGADGVVRILVEGDTVSAGEVIETSANGAVHIQLVNGRALECGPQFSGALTQNLLDLPSGTRIALDGSIHNPIIATTPAPDATGLAPVTPRASSPQDIAALQAAIADGAAPSQVADASAAGGAPGAGTTHDGGGGTPLIIEQANSRGQVTSGIEGGAFAPTEFPDLTTQQIALIQPTEPDSTPPTISVDIPGVRLAPPPPGTDGEPEDPSENVTVSGNIVSLVDGTSAGADPGKILNFVLVLDKPSEVDIKVSYTITALGVENDIDLVDLLGGSITIPAGDTQILVPITISQDHHVELNEAFELVITGATNAVINPAGSTAILNILNDDLPPVARNDAYTANEGENGAKLFSSVISHVDEAEANDDSGADEGETLTVTTTGTINTAQGGHVLINADGTFRYFAPTEDFNGSDSFIYKVTDGFNGESEAVVTISLALVDDVPDAVDNAYSVNEDSTLTITAPGLLGNDTVGDDGGPLEVTSYTQPAHGILTLNDDGGFTYTPTANYNGPDSFTYTIQDADGDTDTATVAIAVSPVDDVPTLDVTSSPGDVYESGLPGGSGTLGTESAQGFQSLSAALPTTASGSLQVGDPEGLSNVTHLNIKGIDYAIDILADGEVVSGNYGTLAISYNALSGVVSYEYTLTQPAFDTPNADEQDIFEVKVKDNTGLYSAPAAIFINIQDDVPTIAPLDALLAAQDGNVIVADLNLVAGADGLKTLVISGETNSEGQVVDVAGNVLTSNESTMTYLQSDGKLYAVTTPGVLETAVFSVTPNTVAGTYAVQLLAPLDTTKVVLAATFRGPDAGAPDDPYTAQFVDQTGANVQIGHLFGVGNLEVNPSTDGLGSGANFISVGDQVGIWLGTQVASVDIALSKFASHGSNNLTTFSWTAFDIDESSVNIANYPDVGTNVDDAVYSLSEFLDSIFVSGNDLIGVVTSGNPAEIIGSAVGGGSATAPEGPAEESDIDTYLLRPEEFTLFDFVMIEQTDGSMKINGMSFESGAITDDVRLNLTMTATDGDLDVTASSFQVTFSGGTDDGYTLTGGATDDALQGSSGNDILIGGGGVDVLYGGGDNDTFKFTDAASADIVKDFNNGGSDVLDIHDLLPVTVLGSTSADTLGAYLQLVVDDAGNTVVMINLDVSENTAVPAPLVTRRHRRYARRLACCRPTENLARSARSLTAQTTSAASAVWLCASA